MARRAPFLHEWRTVGVAVLAWTSGCGAALGACARRRLIGTGGCFAGILLVVARRRVVSWGKRRR